MSTYEFGKDQKQTDLKTYFLKKAQGSILIGTTAQIAAVLIAVITTLQIHLLDKKYDR